MGGGQHWAGIGDDALNGPVMRGHSNQVVGGSDPHQVYKDVGLSLQYQYGYYPDDWLVLTYDVWCSGRCVVLRKPDYIYNYSLKLGEEDEQCGKSGEG